MIHRYLPYTITLRAPALLASFGDDPSSTRSLSFVPGSAIRGQVAQAIGDPSGQPDRQELFTHLILDGSVCCLNAYPRAGGHRTLPMPVSFQVEKNAPQSSDGTISVCEPSPEKSTTAATSSGQKWPSRPSVKGLSHWAQRSRYASVPGERVVFISSAIARVAGHGKNKSLARK